MARINLLTIHWGCSYGGTMQTYATLKTLRSLGHKVTLINLVHPKIKERKVKLTPGSLLSNVRNLQFHIFRFLHFGRQTKRMYSLDSSLLPKADYTIVGSDQVWNSDITTVIKDAYFLGFAKDTQRLSYASSFGKFEWEENESYTDRIKAELSGFKAVSVREETGVSICRNVFGVDAIQLLDPTLFLTDYSRLVRGGKSINQVFPFLLARRNNEHRKICSLVSDVLGLPQYHYNRYQSIFGRSPQKWLKLMKNSAFIITDSFHGLAFSLLFHKQFLVVCADKKKFARLQSLLAVVKLEDRFIQSYEDLMLRLDIIKEQIDYTSVDKLLEREREKTRNFLKLLDGKNEE